MQITDESARRDFWRAYMYAELPEMLAPHQDRLSEGTGLEFGGSNGIIQAMCPGIEWTTRDYPEYDVLNPPDWGEAKTVVVLDQVLEHVARPWEVFHYLHHFCCMAIITTPFLIGVHPCPNDYWRFAPDGIRHLAEINGFDQIDIRTWGNAEAAYWNARYTNTGNMMANVLEGVWQKALLPESNDPSKPFVVYAVLRKSNW